MPEDRAASALKRILRHLPAVLGLILLCGAVYVVQHEFRSLKIHDIHRALQAIPRHALVISFLSTVAAYGVLTFYDRLGTIYAGHPVSHARAAFASFCAYALAHNLGFAAVSGAAVRYRLYSHWGLSPLEIGKVIGFCSLTFGLGGMTLGGALLFYEPDVVPYLGDHLPVWILYAAGGGLWAVVGAYVTLSTVMPEVRLFQHTIQLPQWRMAMGQVLLASVDVAVTAAILHALLPPAPGLTFARLLGVYLASYAAGLAANLPGGLGVFDGAMLFGLSPYLPAPTIVGAVLVFRLYYYVIPLFLAGTLFAGNELVMRGRTMLHRPSALPRWSEPDLAVAAGTAAVALCGLLLMSLGVLEQHPDFSWIDPDLAWVADQAGEFVPSLIGAALLVLSAALARRVALAWGMTLALLLVSAAFTAAQGDAAWLSGILVLASLLIAPYRHAFYRRAGALTGRLQVAAAWPLATFVVCVLALARFERSVRWLDDDSFWKVILSPDVSNSMRASVALAVVLGLWALWRLLRPVRVVWLPWDAAARGRYAALGGTPPPAADGVVLGEARDSAIAFRRAGRVLLGLGDPVGSGADRASAIWRMRDLALHEGREPAVWGARAALLPVYADLGLTALPLGADGMPLLGRPARREVLADPAAQRFLVCVAERDLRALLPVLRALAREEDRVTA